MGPQWINQSLIQHHFPALFLPVRFHDVRFYLFWLNDVIFKPKWRHHDVIGPSKTCNVINRFQSNGVKDDPAELHQWSIGWRYFKYFGRRYCSNCSFFWQLRKFRSHRTIGWQLWTIDECPIVDQAYCCLGRRYVFWYMTHILWLINDSLSMTMISVVHNSTCDACQAINQSELVQAAADVKTKTDGVVQLASLDAAGDPEILRKVSYFRFHFRY